VLDSRLGEQRGHLLGIRRSEENTFVPDERLTRTLAPFVPPAASAGYELHEIGPVVDMTKDARMAG
jgi:hypothetical protein